MADARDRLAAALADRYRIERELGAGGMATVYLAEDLKHHRNVAIKVLKPELAAVLGAERFVQEIQTTAALSHPNILPLFDSGEADGFLYYVMPYLEGETIREKLNRETQFGIEEAVKITTEVAEALDYAHQHGVIHRDIKPENILLHAGRPMVADFGIALAVSAAAGGRMTETGLSLGTPHYMSPEQATADKQLTARSDVYSLASVLYEMLTGEPPHMGNSAQQIIMKIIADAPRPVTELRKAVPPNVAVALAKALEKLPADRFDSARAFADALLDPHFTVPRVRAPGQARGTRGVRLTPPAILSLGSAVLVLVALALWGWLRPAPSGAVASYAITLSARGGASIGPTLRVSAAISPDGSAIVYEDTLDGQSRLFLKRRAELVPHPLAGTEDARGPFFSPDGTWIGFFQRGKLLKTPTAGGGAVPVADSAYAVDPVSGAWLDDGTIVFTDLSFTLRRVSASGGVSRVVAQRPESTIVSTFLAPLPGARGVLFTACTAFCARGAEYVWDARRDSVRKLIDNGLGALYAAPGDILYMTPDGTLDAAPWDNEALRIAGPAVPVLQGVQTPGFLLSRSGAALYSVGSPTFGRNAAYADKAELVWVDLHGHVEPVDTTWRFTTGRLGGAELSLAPDGKRLAIQLWTDLGYDVWIKPLPAGPPARFTFYAGMDGGPRWTPDGRTVTFASDRPVPGSPRGSIRFALWSRAADGSGEAAPLWHGPEDILRGIWSPDRQWLILQTGPGNLDILAARPGIDSVARPLAATRYDEESPALSPDGRWLAYASDETGTYQVFVSPFPDPQHEKWKISTDEGSAPLWAHHGHELFYGAGDKMMSVQVHPGPPFSVGERRMLFERPQGVRPWSAQEGEVASMDLSPDDKRFIMVRDIRPAASGAPPRLVLVENFLDELREKMAAGKQR